MLHKPYQSVHGKYQDSFSSRKFSDFCSTNIYHFTLTNSEIHFEKETKDLCITLANSKFLQYLQQKRKARKKITIHFLFQLSTVFMHLQILSGALGTITKISSSSEQENNSQPFDASLFESCRHAIIKHALASMLKPQNVYFNYSEFHLVQTYSCSNVLKVYPIRVCALQFQLLV